MLQRCRHLGFATKERNPHTENPGLTSSLAVPIQQQASGPFHGVLTLIFFASAMSVRMAAERYLPALKETARNVAIDLDMGIAKANA